MGFADPDYPALRIAGEILNATEGFLWVSCYLMLGSTSGLTRALAVYSWFRPRVRRVREHRSRGRLGIVHIVSGMQISCCFRCFALLNAHTQSSNSVEAFNQGKAVIQGLADGTVRNTILDRPMGIDRMEIPRRLSSTIPHWTPQRALQSIVSQRVSQPLVVRYESIFRSDGCTRLSNDSFPQALMSFANQALKGVPKDYTTAQLERFQNVSKADVLKALKKYFMPLFDAKSSVAVVVSAPGKVESSKEELEKVGYEVEVRTVGVEEGEESDGSFESGDESDSESESGR